MKLERKKELVARTLNVGKDRVIFNVEMLSEIKEAITKQDVHDLVKSNAIIIKEKGGRLTKPKRKTRRRAGSVKKKVVNRKREYITLTRKLRSYIYSLKSKGKISNEVYKDLRKQIRARNFRSLANMKDHIMEVVK